MDIEKFLNFATTYLTQYVHDFWQTLKVPWLVSVKEQPYAILTADGNSTQSRTVTKTDITEALSNRVWAFIIVSIFFGSTFLQIANHNKDVNLQIVILYVAGSWLLFAAYAHVLARYVLRGTGDFLPSLRASLYILGVAYVLASFASMIISFIVPPVFANEIPFHWVSRATYFIVQGVLLSFLLGRNYRALNNLNLWKTLVFSILAPAPILLINFFAAASQLSYAVILTK